ncbi:MAG TPA: N(G),N(G)-dimethylarginine dimethylaminohydrolase [Longimicrobiales bacterium]|nr:N(G),N(G)-dimethylarginine dimethylaminohydrolase [Longimicrobiales bacterium]
MRIALTRAVSPEIARCELTHLDREPIDLARAAEQHAAYEHALWELGCEVRRVRPAPELPDAVFVEDAAVVLDEIAIITRPGAESRRPETAAVADALREYRPIRAIEAPGTLDGGDVLRIGRTLWVGASSRTNADGIAQLRELLRPFGYRVEGVAVEGALHLKTAATLVAPDLLLVNPAWLPATALDGMARVAVDPAEPFGANALLVGTRALYPAAFPRTLERLQRHGAAVLTVDASELAKAEGGVTCCCIVFEP